VKPAAAKGFQLRFGVEGIAGIRCLSGGQGGAGEISSQS